MADTAPTPQNWFMYHGGYAHGGNAGPGSPLNSANVGSAQFALLHQIAVNGPILSVPAIVDGHIYVGLANSHDRPGSNGGALQQYDIATGQLLNEYTWEIRVEDRDSHGFTGMGCTPTVINGYLYFIGFDAKLHCLKQSDLSAVWVTDLRYADLDHNQPVTNTVGMEQGYPPAAGWSSPLVINTVVDGAPKSRVYVGIGEGENPYLFSFIYCLDGETGIVDWIYCTCQYQAGQGNPVNQLPAQVLLSTPPSMYSVFNGPAVTQGCSVWAAIAYDETTGYLYASTGQPASPVNANFDQGLPSAGWSSGILALDAATGEFINFTQMPMTTAYRPTDLDVDIGSACTLYTLPRGSAGAETADRRVVAVGCKNGGFMICDAHTLELINSTSLLPRYKDGTQVDEIDPHPPLAQQNAINPRIPNDVSNVTWGENYFGPFNTAAIDPLTHTLFIAIGGPNYHNAAPGIDSKSTPFMKAVKWDTLQDAWELDDSFDPPRYKNVGASMYTNAGESGLSSPAVAADVVFVSTSGVSIYAFKTSDGSLLWSDRIGNQTLGFNGGYGYCLGPAIWGAYVVAGALIQGLNGGLLNIYGLKS